MTKRSLSLVSILVALFFNPLVSAAVMIDFETRADGTPYVGLSDNFAFNEYEPLGVLLEDSDPVFPGITFVNDSHPANVGTDISGYYVNIGAFVGIVPTSLSVAFLDGTNEVVFDWAIGVGGSNVTVSAFDEFDALIVSQVFVASGTFVNQAGFTVGSGSALISSEATISRLLIEAQLNHALIVDNLQFDVTPDEFTWPVGFFSPIVGHDGPCGDWPSDATGCYWLDETLEDANVIWRDAQPFQRHKYRNMYHLGADYNLGARQDDDGLPVYPVAPGTITDVKTNQCGWGNVIFVRHDATAGVFTSMYAHVEWLESGPPVIGSEVDDPEIPIAYVGSGSWGNKDCGKRKEGSYPAHLHLEIREGTNTSNGLAYSPSRVIKGPQGQIDPNAFIASH